MNGAGNIEGPWVVQYVGGGDTSYFREIDFRQAARDPSSLFEQGPVAHPDDASWMTEAEARRLAEFSNLSEARIATRVLARAMHLEEARSSARRMHTRRGGMHGARQKKGAGCVVCLLLGPTVVLLAHGFL